MKYNFTSTYIPTANQTPENEETNVEGAVEETEIQSKACFRNAILYDPVNYLRYSNLNKY